MTGAGARPKGTEYIPPLLPNKAGVRYIHPCGLLVLKARYMGVRARKGHQSPGTRKLPRPGYRPWRTAPPGGSGHLRERLRVRISAYGVPSPSASAAEPPLEPRADGATTPSMPCNWI